MTMPPTPASRNRRIRLMPDLAGYITTQEAAQKLGYHIIYVRRMVREGKLQGKKIGQMWLVSIKSIEAYQKDTTGMSKNDPRRRTD
jgi:excisionase family DNA binding protein